MNTWSPTTSPGGMDGFVTCISDPFVRPPPTPLSPIEWHRKDSIQINLAREDTLVPATPNQNSNHTVHTRESFQVVSQILDDLAHTSAISGPNIPISLDKKMDSTPTRTQKNLVRLSTITAASDNPWVTVKTNCRPIGLHPNDSFVTSVMASPCVMYPKTVADSQETEIESKHSDPRDDAAEDEKRADNSDITPVVVTEEGESETVPSLVRNDTAEIVSEVLPSLSVLGRPDSQLSFVALTRGDTAEILTSEVEVTREQCVLDEQDNGDVSAVSLDDESSVRKPTLIRVGTSVKPKMSPNSGYCENPGTTYEKNPVKISFPKRSKNDKMERRVSFRKLVKVNTSGESELKLSSTYRVEGVSEKPAAVLKQRKVRKNQQKRARYVAKRAQRVPAIEKDYDKNASVVSWGNTKARKVKSVGDVTAVISKKRSTRKSCQKDMRFVKTWSLRSKSETGKEVLNKDPQTKQNEGVSKDEGAQKIRSNIPKTDGNQRMAGSLKTRGTPVTAQRRKTRSKSKETNVKSWWLRKTRVSTRETPAEPKNKVREK